MTEVLVGDLRTYERRAASLGYGFEVLTPALADNFRLRGVFGLGLETWRLGETETYHYAGGVYPDTRYDNGYGVYFGWESTLGLRLEITRQAHAELRLEVSRVNFLAVFKDRSFNAPVRVTTGLGWRF